MGEGNSENCACETHLIRINLPIQSFTLVKENFENCVCETLHIGCTSFDEEAYLEVRVKSDVSEKRGKTPENMKVGIFEK